MGILLTLIFVILVIIANYKLINNLIKLFWCDVLHNNFLQPTIRDKLLVSLSYVELFTIFMKAMYDKR